jgi:hypothetical protein
MVFGWFKSEQREKRKKVTLDRIHLEARTRRFLSAYLAVDEMRKPHFYRAVEAASKECRSMDIGAATSESEDAQIAENAQIAQAISNAAMKIVLGPSRAENS